MPTQKKVIIGTRKNLVEATVRNRSEVVEYLQQHNWHLDRETFIRVAPDEYCLVSKSALTPDMNIVSERVVYTWSTAETTELKKLREYKEWGTKAYRLLVSEMMVLCVILVPATFFAWSRLYTFGKYAICAAWLAFLGTRICIFASLDDTESDTKNSGK
jgi:hypothetical protein